MNREPNRPQPGQGAAWRLLPLLVVLLAFLPGRPASYAATGNASDSAAALKRLKSGDRITIQGRISGTFKFSGLRDIQIKGLPGTTISGPGSGYVFWFSRCTKVGVSGLTLTGGQLGCYVMGGSGLSFQDCHFDSNRQSGFLTDGASAGPVDGVTLLRCTGNNNRDEHGAYGSDRTKNLLIQDSTFKENGRGDREVDLQFNGEDGGAVEKVTLRNVTLGSGKKHQTALTIKRVQVFTATGLKITGQQTGIVIASGSRGVNLGHPTFVGVDTKLKVEGSSPPAGWP